MKPGPIFPHLAKESNFNLEINSTYIPDWTSFESQEDGRFVLRAKVEQYLKFIK
jgi:hypothetical protein